MTRYETIEGTKFSLAHHDLDEWAQKTRDKLVSLGCSRKYATRQALLIRSAAKEGSWVATQEQ